MAKSYLKIKEQEILQEVDLLKSVKHPVVKGGQLEDLLIRFLREELPKQYSVDSGFVIGLRQWQDGPLNRVHNDKSGKFRSKEMDIVIFDEQRNISPLKLLRKRDFYVEGVYAILSVKSVLDSKSFSNSKTGLLDNLISAKKIKTHSYSHSMMMRRKTSDSQGSFVSRPVISVGIAFDGVELKTIKSYLDSEAKKYNFWWDIFPDLIVVLGKGILFIDEDNQGSSFYNTLKAPKNSLEEFFYHLLSLLNAVPTIHPVGLTAYRDFYK